MADSTLAFDILARDHASSAFDKVARSADKTSAALKKSVKISDDVAKAEARLSKARDSESDALGRVHVAETKLAEVRGNSNAKTSQIVQAEEQLSSARRKAAQASNTAKTAEDSLGKARSALAKNAETIGKDAGGHFGKGFGDGAEKEGTRSGKRFGASLKKWITGSGADLGKEGGTVFGSGFLGALKTPILGPALILGLGGAVAVAAPAVGAIAASGIVAGFGAGLAGLGLVFAAKSKVVQDVWKRTLSGMGAQMQVLSKPFENTLLAMSIVAKRTFATFAPALGQAFKSVAPALTAFGDQLGRAFEKLAPAIGPLADAFSAVLKSLGPATVSAIGNVSSGLIKLAESVKRSPDGLADLVKGIGDVTRASLDVITKLNDINAAFKNLIGASAVTVVMDGVTSSVRGLGIALGVVTAPVTGLDALMQKLGLRTKDAGTSTGTFSQSLIATAAAINKTIAPAETLAQKFDRQAAATQRANDALTRQSSLLLTLSGSQIAYQAAVDDATAAVKENGKTHDINTAKGRANKTALDQVAASAQAQTVAMRNAGDGNVAAAKHAETAKASFIKLATQMGYTVPEAKRMADSLIKIPNVTRTAKLTANKKDLETKLAAAKTELANPNLTKERKAKLNADIAKLKAGIAAAKAALAGVPNSKTVVITTKYQTIGSRSSGAGFGGGHENTRATGGPVKKGVPYWVGEKGPEPFIPDQNGTIIPNHKAKAGGGTPLGTGGGSVSVSLRVESGGSRMDDMLAELIRRYVRVNGGDVQRVLGRG